MITTNGKESIAKAMGAAISIPTHIAIGTGSSTMVSGTNILLSETDRNALSSLDTSSLGDVTYISDFSANEISGTTLWEFGLFNTSAGGSTWDRVVIGSVEFAGDKELQIQMTHRYLISGA